MVRTKGNKGSFGRWETFLVSACAVCTKIAIVACCASTIARWLFTRPLAGSQANSFFAWGDHSNYLCETYLAIDKIQNTAFFWCLLHYRVCMSFSITHGFSKVCFFHTDWERSIIAVRSFLPIKRLREHKNNGCTRACILLHTVEWCENGTLSPQNDRTTELNVNFLLTATVWVDVYSTPSSLGRRGVSCLG